MAGMSGALRTGLPESGEDVLVQAEDVPVEPVGQWDGPIAEPVDLGQLQRVEAHPAEDDPPAGRAQVDRRPRKAGRFLGGHGRRFGRLLDGYSSGSSQECGSDAGVDRDVQSGGLERSPAMRAKTAAATCSGSTSFPSSVRLA